MFQIPCPHCGDRNVSEFRHWGEQADRPDPSSATPAEWRGYLYGRRNLAGWTTETWYHRAGCRTFVTVERHTVSNEVRPSLAAAGVVQAGSLPSTDAGAPDAGGSSS